MGDFGYSGELTEAEKGTLRFQAGSTPPGGLGEFTLGKLGEKGL